MNSIYNDLIKQYNKLTEDEKNLLLIYKSRLSIFINNINNLEDKKLYNEYLNYKNIIELEENIFIKLSVFKDIDFSSYPNFIISIKNIYDKLINISNKITLKDDLVVYRGTTVKNNSDIERVSKDNLVSTTINLEETDNFYTYDGQDVLYQINLYKDTPCMIIPYSIKIIDIKDKQILKIIKDDSQKEIILNKQYIDFNIVDIKTIDKEKIKIVKVDTNIKKQKNFKK